MEDIVSGKGREEKRRREEMRREQNRRDEKRRKEKRRKQKRWDQEKREEETREEEEFLLWKFELTTYQIISICYVQIKWFDHAESITKPEAQNSTNVWLTGEYDDHIKLCLWM